MSSLAAARADGFYYPPDFYDEENMKKHGGSLNKYNGQHPLRERAKKLDQGILVIRFEVPFHIYCGKCNEMIAKGERFNAEKKSIGNYLSTKIWQFSMRHHCGNNMVIQTDPKNAEYLVVEGARKKVETYSSKDIGVIELESTEEKEMLRSDPFYKLEFGEKAKAKANETSLSLAELQGYNDVKHYDNYEMNKNLRAMLRKVKRDDADLEARRQELNLHSEVHLLPEVKEDADRAALAFFIDERSGHQSERASDDVRRKIMSQSIFNGRFGGSNGSTDSTSSARLDAATTAAAKGGRLASTPTSLLDASGPASSSGPSSLALMRISVSHAGRRGVLASTSSQGAESGPPQTQGGSRAASAVTGKGNCASSSVGESRAGAEANGASPGASRARGGEAEQLVEASTSHSYRHTSPVDHADRGLQRLGSVYSQAEASYRGAGKFVSSTGTVGRLLPSKLPGSRHGIPAGPRLSSSSRDGLLKAPHAAKHAAMGAAWLGGGSGPGGRPVPKGLIGAKRRPANSVDPLLDRAQALAKRHQDGRIIMHVAKPP